eukprot:CAMPEP_0194027388 /NCGR_PEP_ID=MMETSP0009_2-20130614/1542_1 /TAXON_ID=210454 /ORGANISM="Grammatophora oceanica, Strain CCMP 410" /LENGTH=236 /DNA_ID=CAMNT_0038666435 /DNA_START=134 /DNA_END=844 /DNA_ORIENTATION=-
MITRLTFDACNKLVRATALISLSIVQSLAVARGSQEPYGVSEYLIELRRLEGVDEDDDEYFGPPDEVPKPWWYLSRYVDPNSIVFDFIQGFFFVGCLLLLVWLVWNCCVDIGYFPDPRLDRKRDIRRRSDGRGVFAPLASSDLEDIDDDNASVESMEYGHSHLDDAYGDVDPEKEGQNLQKAAKKYFKKEEKKGKPRRSKRQSRGQESGEDAMYGDLLDMEMVESKPKVEAKTVFL